MKTAIPGILFGLFAGVLIGSRASAQEHRHPPQDAVLHEKFYSTWMMPDAPRTSCCHNEDCAPAASRFVDGRWEARREQDENWTPIPESKIELNRDSPDGRSHLCGRKLLGGFAVFCFVRGNGT